MKYVKRPIIVEANQFLRHSEAPLGVRGREDGTSYVVTIHGDEIDLAPGDWVILEALKCVRCEGDGKAHGSDRPFEWSGPGTFPGPCPACGGAGVVSDGTRAYPCKPDVFERTYELVKS